MKTLFIIFCMVVLWTFVSCNGGGKPGYPAIIQKQDGVTRISNPGYPENGTHKFRLEPELTIGNENDDNYVFANIRQIVIDSKGNIYTVDWKRCRVQAFNKKGKHLFSIGSKGKGPGEFLGISWIALDEEKKIIHILDGRNNRISRYSLNGKLLSSTKLISGYPRYFYLGNDLVYNVVTVDIDDDGNQKYRLSKHREDGTPLKHSLEFQATAFKVKKAGQGMISGGTPFDPGSFMVSDNAGHLFYGFSNKYEFKVYNNNYEIIEVFSRKDTGAVKIPVAIREAFGKKIKEKLIRKGMPPDFVIDLPGYYPLYDRIWLIDGSGDFIVKVKTDNDKAQLDIYNKEGIYREKWLIDSSSDKISLPEIFKRSEFKHGWLYGVVEESELLVVKKYKLTPILKP